MTSRGQQSWANDSTAFFVIAGQPQSQITLSGTPVLVLTNSGGELLGNGVAIDQTSNWSAFFTLSNEVLFDASNKLRIVGNDLYFNNEILAVASNISNVADWYLYPALSNVLLDTSVGISFDGSLLTNTVNGLEFDGTGLSPAFWSQYPANTNVNLGGNNIDAANTIKAEEVRGTSGSNSNLTLTSAQGVLSNVGRDVSILASDPGVGSTADVDITAQGGSRGRVNVTANAGTAGLNGEVNIVANGGTVGGLQFGGLVTITANSVVGLSNLPSRVSVGGATITSYAGAISPFTGTPGYNYIHGDIGINLTTGLGSLIPNTAGTIYLYGVAGTNIQNGLGVDEIKTYYNPLTVGPPSNLLITKRVVPLVGTGYVNLEGVNHFYMESNALISNVNSIQMGGTGRTITNVADITTSGINGSPYVPTSNWSTFPALNPVVLNATNSAAITVGSNVFGSPTAGLETVQVLNSLSGAGNIRVAEVAYQQTGGAANDIVTYCDPSGGVRMYVDTSASTNTVAYLSDLTQYQAQYYKTAVQNLTSGNTDITFDGVQSWNTTGGFITHTNGTTDFTVVQSGVYQLEFAATILNNGATYSTTTNRSCVIDITRPSLGEQAILPSGVFTVAGLNYGQFVTGTVYLEAGDVINCRIGVFFTGGPAQVQSIQNTFDYNTTFTWRYVSGSGTIVPSGVVGAFSSSATQTVSAANTVTGLTLTDTDYSTGSISLSGGYVRVGTGGVYECIPSIQFDKTGGGIDTVDFWLQTSSNAVTWNDVPRSATQIAVAGTNGETVGTVSVILPLTVGDYIRVAIASADATMQARAFAAQAAPFVRPAIPSVIMSIKTV